MDLSPTKLTEVDLKITNVCCHPKGILVKFQGSYNTDREFDYHILQNEIQQVSKVKDCIGSGDFCLAEDPNSGEWYRGRVIQKKNHIYEVFLIDNGKKLAVPDTSVASATDELFQLPPKMVHGIFANILPLEEKWSLKALNYFSSLTNLKITGHIQAIMPHQTFLLDAPKVTSDVVVLKLGKLVDADSFHLIVELLAELPEEPLYQQMSDLIQKEYMRLDSVISSARIQVDFQPVFGQLQPLLSVGGAELAKISVAVSPSKFYCQPLKCLRQLDELTGSMSSYYETINRGNVPLCDSLEVLCAAKRKDGCWYRGVIQQLLSDNSVKVWFVDIGNCEAVPSTCVLKLQSKFISIPAFSFPCALSCLSDQNDSVRNSQLKEFKEALLRQSMVHVHIDLFDANKYLYHVTLHKHKTLTNEEYLPQRNDVLKHKTLMNDEYLPQRNDVLPKYDPSSKTEIGTIDGHTGISGASPLSTEPAPRNMLQSRNCSNTKRCSLNTVLPTQYKTAEMKIDSVCVAFVEYVLNPSNFWVQTDDNVDKCETLMDKVSDVYDADETGDKSLENPEPGMLCCARYKKDRHFYRAVIGEVFNSDVTVYFLDFGNTETVSIFDVRTLLPEFQELPALAISCSLASAFPVEDIWIKKETDFFKNLVFDKPITLHVVGKQDNKYSVNMHCMNGSEQADVLQAMVQAGYAECWQVKPDPLLNIINDSKKQDSKIRSKHMQRKNLVQDKNIVARRNSHQLLDTLPLAKKAATNFPQWERILSEKYGKMSGESYSTCPYKEYRFNPGTVVSVICCSSPSPGDFSCQLQAKLPELGNLMEQIQIYYNAQTIPYQSGQLACVVKDSEDGKWYRACMLKYVSETRIEVVLVDYGNQMSVSLADVQTIIPDFLTLECQAFRCCLSSVTNSLKFDPDKWTAEACSDFKSFISSSNGLLTCSISALIIKSPGCLYNVVDIWTPSVRAQQFLLDCGHDQFCSLECPSSLAPSFSLYSFYYSSFDVKIGNVEEVCITYINSPTKFYCQLNRNADDIDNLVQKITEISHMASCAGQINTCRLYLARYFEDGLFYRALASPVVLSDYLPVYFVDFGNKQVVAKDELIHIPDHVSEILFTPMQAVKCYLSDLKDTEIPVEINKWFENNFLGKELKAVIMAKESDGQLGVELYDNHLQISKKIKELLLDSKTECDEYPAYVNRDVEKPLEDQNVKPKEKITAIKRETKNKINFCHQNDGDVYADYGKETVVDPQKQCSRSVKVPVACENTELVLQNTVGEKDKNTTGEFGDDASLELKEMPTDNMTESHNHQLSPSGQERSTSAKQNYRDLVPCNIQLNSKAMVYVSFVTSPSSFCVHLEVDEDKILQLAEELNQQMLVLEPQTDIEEGDIVLAEYEVDHCIYRAAVRAVKSEAFCEVEFIDYGNCSVVNASKIYKVGEKYLKLPRLSIHCFISRAKYMLLGENWNSDVTAYFVSKVNAQLVICQFLQQHGEQWEVDLFYHGISVVEDLMQMETSLSLQNMSMLDAAEDVTVLPMANAGTEVKDQSYQVAYKESEFVPTWESLPKINYQKIDPGQLENAEISHISRNGYFYVKLNKDVQTLLNLNMMATQEAEQMPVAVENIQEGLECLAKSNVTCKWYRSEIIKKLTNTESMLVFFMDLGIYEVVSFSDTRRLSSEMRSIPRCAVPCKWVWIENVDSLIFERILKMLKGQEIKVLFVRYLESLLIWQVDILVNGIVLLECWPKLSCQRMLDKLLGGLNNVKMTVPKCSFRWSSVSWAEFQSNRHYLGFVTSISDPSNFCIQLEDSFKTMEVLFKLLSGLPENLPTMPKDLVRIGASYLIKTEPNKKWNRVEVSEISDHFMLTYVDDGISAPIPISEFHRLKVIPQELINTPRLTYPCCLFGVSPVLGEQWNDEAKCKIQQFLGRQGLRFQYRQFCGMKMEVDVLHEGTNAADVLVASGCAVYSFMSVNQVESKVLNSQILHNPLQMSSRKSSEVRMILQPGKEECHKKSDLLFKHACNKCQKECSSKKRSQKQQLRLLALPSKRRKNENPLRYNRSFIGQCCHGDGLKETYPADVSAETTHKMSDPSGLSTILDVMKITDENPSNKSYARKLKVD